MNKTRKRYKTIQPDSREHKTQKSTKVRTRRKEKWLFCVYAVLFKQEPISDSGFEFYAKIRVGIVFLYLISALPIDK